MKICLQDPNNGVYSLHEELLLASIGSIKGGAVFAFATKNGVSLLLKDEIFIEFLQHSVFLLIVGTDEITNQKTIEELLSVSDLYPNLKIKAFVHSNPNTTFHPKYCWFKNAEGGIAIVGSGNLTQQGLRRNWEAFSIIDLTVPQVRDFETNWNSWLYQNQEYIKELDDPLVLEKAKENNRIITRSRTPEQPEPRDDSAPLANNELPSDNIPNDEFEAWQFSLDSRVLIAEIPRASKRWNQANFNKDSFTNFFGATPGDNALRVLFRGVDDNHVLHETEVRQSVSVKSHNWRFELDLAKGEIYPENGRPTGIFICIAKRMFLYMLLLPNSHGYAIIHDLLQAKQPLGIRRLYFTAKEVYSVAPELAIWDFLK